MALSYHMTAIVFLMYYSVTTFASQPGNNTIVRCKINRNTLNGKSNSANCNLQIDEPESTIEDILRLQHESTTNIVNLKVTVVSENETRCFPKTNWPWANEIGRTILSLALRAKDTIFNSPLFTLILEVGTHEVDIQVTEETDGCLPPGDEGFNRIFDFLLHRLSQTKDTKYFGLCRVKTHGTYNCCQIIRGRNLTICDNYSSLVVDFALPAIIVIFSLSFFMVIPFVLEHIITYPTIKFYKTSDNPMSLTSILSMMFFEGRGPAISLFRKCVFVLLLYAVCFLPNFTASDELEIVFWVWAGFFVISSYEVLMTHGECEIERGECKKPKWDRNLILCFKIPFFLFRAPKKCPENDGGENRFYSIVSYLRDLIYGFIICVWAIVYFSIFYPLLVVMCLLKFAVWDLACFFIWPFCRAEGWETKVLLLFIRLPTLGLSVFFVGMILMLAVAIVVGFVLNAEYFGPFVVPIVTLITYLWKNWKFSVEGEFLNLKTSIIKICKERALPGEYENISVNNTIDNSELSSADRFLDFLCSCLRDTSKDPHTWECFCCNEQDASGNGGSQHSTCSKGSGTTKSDEKSTLIKGKNYSKFGKYFNHGKTGINDNNEDSSVTTLNTDTNQPSTSGNSGNAKLASNDDKLMIIKFDEHGEAMISKELYESVTKEILPLENLLFYFFRRVIFICLYAFVVFTVMILVRDSGASLTVQAINAIVSALIPFIFDTIFADHHSPQKKCVDMATREKLEHILKVHKRENRIYVKLINININNGKSQSNKVPKKTENMQRQQTQQSNV